MIKSKILNLLNHIAKKDNSYSVELYNATLINDYPFDQQIEHRSTIIAVPSVDGLIRIKPKTHSAAIAEIIKRLDDAEKVEAFNRFIFKIKA